MRNITFEDVKQILMECAPVLVGCLATFFLSRKSENHSVRKKRKFSGARKFFVFIYLYAHILFQFVFYGALFLNVTYIMRHMDLGEFISASGCAILRYTFIAICCCFSAFFIVGKAIYQAEMDGFFHPNSRTKSTFDKNQAKNPAKTGCNKV